MKVETKKIYVAFDGTQFDTEHACLAHEREKSGARLVNLTEADIADALSGKNRELGDAIEAVAKKIRDGRYERGDLRRRPKDATEPETPPSDAVSAEDDGDGDPSQEAP